MSERKLLFSAMKESWLTQQGTCDNDLKHQCPHICAWSELAQRRNSPAKIAMFFCLCIPKILAAKYVLLELSCIPMCDQVCGLMLVVEKWLLFYRNMTLQILMTGIQMGKLISFGLL